MDDMEKICHLLNQLYGSWRGSLAFEKITGLLDSFAGVLTGKRRFFSQNDVILISYSDSITDHVNFPLKVLHNFATGYLRDAFSTIHLLPFFPYSSDDGFSVVDYFKVNPDVGNWHDIACLAQDFDLMFDFVLNHVSARSYWFENYLSGESGFADLAIEVDTETDLSLVTRPRTHSLLTPFVKHNGENVSVWTTFSDDQIDLNYNSIEVLIKMVEVLLFYIANGARMLRLDAIAYLWKKIGTTCIHLKQTHAVVRLFRMILDQVAPDVLLITETNVPHEENVSYFGNGKNEAQMVYNFSLPPLLLQTLKTQDSRILSDWVKNLTTPSIYTAFFNFTASHDGIGLRPLEGILPPDEIDRLARHAIRAGGQVSYKQNGDGTQSPYELNVTYVDAVCGNTKDIDSYDPTLPFLASQAIAMALPGVPGVYIHSILGSRNWIEGVQQTGRARSINRKQLVLDDLVNELRRQDSFRAKIFHPYIRLLKLRRQQPAFHPRADTSVLTLDCRIFGLKRETDQQTIFALTNIGHESVTTSLKRYADCRIVKDLISNTDISTGNITLKPYQTQWLASE